MKKTSLAIVASGLFTLALSSEYTLIPAFGQADTNRDPYGNGAHWTALEIVDPAMRAAALEEYLGQYPRFADKGRVLEEELEAYRQAGDTAHAKAVTVEILKREPHNHYAMAVLFGLKPEVIPGTSPTDRLAAMACEAAKWNNPSLVNYPEWVFILRFRDASPCNRAAADLVWDTIQKRQREERASLTGTIISGNRQTVALALNSTSASAKIADVTVTLPAPLPDDPPIGARVDVLGRITGYKQQPFSLTMTEVELRLGCNINRRNPNIAFEPYSLIEYLLENRDSTPCTQEAADVVWSTLQKGPSRVTAQIVSATENTIDAAIVEKDWRSRTPDLRVNLAKPLRYVPKPGDMLRISGVFTKYETNPLRFTLEQGEAPGLICEWLHGADPAETSPADWPYIFEASTGSYCNTAIARRLWDGIKLRQQMNGGKLRLPVRIISTSPRQIGGAIAEGNRQTNQVDIQIHMIRTMSNPPALGTIVEVTGTVSGYTQRPPYLQMFSGELATAPPR
jgi:hypothetical protein